ncbi:winged helix DNA-binding domain-containing protein [Luedemannella helvata]|uniref:Winged helix DNA-binding domain-containing protein n=1 Tax=Luedemannella helvata TaxID=349315 RepID=A0ABN2JQZ8_9ACTN
MELSRADALALRMMSLLLADRPADYPSPAPDDVAGVVTWFGAMQAQDIGSAAWSFGARLPKLTTTDLDEAFERREAIRTWPMRGTVHYVPPRDAHWMLDLMGVRALAGAAKRREFLGLTQEIADRSVDVLGAAMAGGKRLTRAECITALNDAGVPVTGQLGYHLLWYASQRGVTCFAPNIGKEQAFMLLDEWVPDPHRPERDEALATIATRYFRSHGPTTRQDFVGWTGLTATDGKRAIAAAGDALATVRVDGTEMFADRALLESFTVRDTRVQVRALPGFDEYLLGFKDRSMMLDDEHKQKIIPGGNGIFQPTVVRAGRVVGTWRRAVKRAHVDITVTPFATLTAKDRRAAEAAFEPYARFIGMPVKVSWP